MTNQQQIEQEYLEAERLVREPAFQRAVLEIRAAALEALATVDPTEADKIRECQASVRAIDLLSTSIGGAIIRGKTNPRSNPVA